ncbi:hypothetical protein [Sedimentibacter sp.]|uniref:hypothetical protein n=1 Tax=Sedimentibacter sp. TaxID=1960295 RepID=UPI0028AA138D|nr:hypothetical protein [Sedimentibacter sp.]
MKKIINAIRDFLYNITDYGLIVTVILVMVVILGWRFNILMNKGIEKEVIKDNLPEIIADNEDKDPVSPENPGQVEEDPEGEPDDEEPSQEPTKPVENSGLIATINIPEGSFPSKIGDILLNSNLIENKEDFLDRSVELGLDTRLRSGTFDIEVGTSLDNIIKIIANAQ